MELWEIPRSHYQSAVQLQSPWVQLSQNYQKQEVAICLLHFEFLYEKVLLSLAVIWPYSQVFFVMSYEFGQVLEVS